MVYLLAQLHSERRTTIPRLFLPEILDAQKDVANGGYSAYNRSSRSYARQLAPSLSASTASRTG